MRAAILRQRGLSKLEFVVVAVIISVLVGMLLTRTSDVQLAAERTEVDLTVRNIRAGIRMAVDAYTVRGQWDRLGTLAASNPVVFLSSPPRGYAGEAAASNIPGSWRFDPQIHVLAYRPRQPEAFEGETELRWRMSTQRGIDGHVAGIELKNIP